MQENRSRDARVDCKTPMIALYRLLSLAIFLLLWWGASWLAGKNLVPTPAATLEAAIGLAHDRRLWAAILDSLSVYLSGFALAALVAIPLGLLMGGFRTLGRTLDVYVNALTATPRVAFIPLIIVTLGLGFEAKVAIIFLGAVMPILINTYAGVLNTDGELVEMARATGASSDAIFRKIMLPGALPFIVVGLRLGATIGLINTVVAELYTAVRGLGGLLAVYGNTFQMAPYFVIVLVLAAIGVIITQALRAVEIRMERWRYDGR
jgi:NitT/TauT family transport system permease protein